jgi:tetratricopeptide (TPR) repeat protein
MRRKNPIMISRRSLIKGMAAAPFLPLIEQHISRRPAFAKDSSSFDPSINPFEAGPKVAALAQKAKSETPLESAKKLHELSKGFKLVNSGSGIRDTRAPRTAEQTLSKGGDCTEHAYAIIAALKKLGIDHGMIVLHRKGKEFHVVPYAKINKTRYLMDTQSKTFGKSAVTIKKILMTMRGEEAASFYFMEQGNYLQHKKGKELDAIRALVKALEIHPNNTFAKKKLVPLQGILVNRFANIGIKLFNAGKYPEAAQMFEKAIKYFPDELKKKNAAQIKQLQQLLKQAQAAAKEN